MHAYKIVKTVSEDSTVNLESLPFAAGEIVEITIMPHRKKTNDVHPGSLAGSVSMYDKPFEPVAQDDWDAVQ